MRDFTLPQEFPAVKATMSDGAGYPSKKRKPLVPPSQLRDAVGGEAGDAANKAPSVRLDGILGGSRKGGSLADRLALRRTDSGGSGISSSLGPRAGPPALDLSRLPGIQADLPSARGGWAGSASGRQATTFADVTCVRQADDDATMDQEDLMLLNKVQFQGQGPAALPRGVEEVEYAAPPCDWSLKRKMTFLSPRPFPLERGIAQGTRALRPRAGCKPIPLPAGDVLSPLPRLSGPLTPAPPAQR
mmetsp:Transcript_22775/g.70757  ORF Transcript_22775/g.70757 Transcript_22775/m.70757 type:complete len:245 (+) Transcript_22775:809-1543(+)